MANTFKNSITGSIGIGETVVYQVPAATVSTIIGVNVANVTAGNINVSVLLTDTSAAKSAYLVKDLSILSESSAVLVGGDQKIVLEAGDTVKVTSSSASSADVILSVLEIS